MEPEESTLVLSATVHAAATPSSTVVWQSPAGYTVASHVALKSVKVERGRVLLRVDRECHGHD
jgi:hypothetical protein